MDTPVFGMWLHPKYERRGVSLLLDDRQCDSDDDIQRSVSCLHDDITW